MADLGLSDIASDPNYVNANPATKKAIFDKFSAKDQNYSGANPATQAAIRKKFGVEEEDIEEPVEEEPHPMASQLGREGRVEPEQTGEKTDMEAVFNQKSDLEKKLKAEGKDPSKDPQWKLLTRKLARGQSAQTQEAAGFAGAPAVKEIGEAVVKKVAGPAARLVGRATSKAPEQAAEEATKAAGSEQQGLKTELEAGESAKAAEAEATRRSAQGEAQQTEQQAGTEAQSAEDKAAQEAQRTETEAQQRAAKPEATAQKAAATKAKIEAQAARQPEVAAQRQAAQAPGKVLSQGRAVAENPDAVRQADVRTKLKQERIARIRQAERDHVAAGATTEQAKSAVAQHEAEVAAAQQGGEDLDKQLAAQPQMDVKQFGGKIRQIAQGIWDRFSQTRSRESNFAGAIADAGQDARVPTTDALGLIDAKLKNIGNPDLEATLHKIRAQFLTDDKEAINVEKAESLRKYLKKVEDSKTITTDKGPLPVDKDALQIVKALRKELTRSARNAWPPYGRALDKFAELSRPLNVVEHKGALRKTIDKDPFGTGYANTEAEVVGQVIRKAGKGHPAFARLMQEDPSIRDAAKLYFAKDLFGESAALPKPGAFNTWLKANEGVLKQLNLYDDFKNMKLARRAAQAAVDQAKDVHGLSLQQLKAAEERETAAKKAEGLAKKLLDKEIARQKAHPNATVIETRVGGKRVDPAKAVSTLEKQADKARAEAERIRAESQTEAEKLRAKGEVASEKIRMKGAAEAEKIRSTGETKAATAAALKEDFGVWATQLKNKEPEQVATALQDIGHSLVSKGLITKEKYDILLQKSTEIKAKFAASKAAAADRAAARASLKKLGLGVLYAAAVAPLGYPAYKVIKGALGW